MEDEPKDESDGGEEEAEVPEVLWLIRTGARSGNVLMVSSRLLCVECGTCEGEPYTEIDVEEDEDGKAALKSAIANVVNVHQSGAPLPVIDIRNCWHRVASDGFIALLVSVPFISLFAGRYMWKHYLVSRWKLIFPPEHTWGQHLRHWIASEALMWLMLVDVVLGDIFTCDGTMVSTMETCNAKSQFQRLSPRHSWRMLPVQMLTNALSVTSLLLLRTEGLGAVGAITIDKEGRMSTKETGAGKGSPEVGMQNAIQTSDF
eukprot:symbB.v1.2.025180.t1/scaffold2432.1/size79237/7